MEWTIHIWSILDILSPTLFATNKLLLHYLLGVGGGGLVLDGHVGGHLDALDVLDGALAAAGVGQAHQVLGDVVRVHLLGVLLVLVLDLEEALALLAVVGLVGVVDAEHVLLEVRQLREALAAELAGVRLLARVHAQVQLQRRRVREGARADLARIPAMGNQALDLRWR